MTEKEKRLSEGVSSGRRRFLAGAGTVAGLAMIGNAAGLTDPDGGEPVAASAVDEPLPYAELDPEEAKRLGRENYHDGMHCGQGAFDAVITLLREEVGEPYTQIPTTATYWSAGGGSGWSAVCGAVVGSNTAISLVKGDTGETMTLVDELQRWYTQHPFPQYTPPKDAGGITKEFPTSQPGSILCHASVTDWCQKSGYASGSSERSERCSRLTGETAARAVELLNAHAAGRFEMEADAKAPMSVDTEKGCRACHRKGSDFDQGQFTRGKMECMNCHGGAPHLPDSLKK